jgi:hypothetical protein
MTDTIEIEQAGQIQVAKTAIEDPRDHSLETQERLRHLLASGAPVRPDPKRTDVFEIEDHERIFYVHVAKTSGKVMLLAVWNRNAEDNPAAYAATPA